MLDKIVGDIINRDRKLVCVDEEDVVLNACKKMKNSSVGCLVVKNADGDITGIVTERDLVTKVMASDLDALEVRVKNAMTRTAIAIHSNATVYQAMGLMSKMQIRHLLVIDNDSESKQVIGMLSGRDIIACEFDIQRAKLHQLNSCEDTVEDTIYSYLQ